MAVLEITFSELAAVALSTTELTHTHIAVLHSLVQMLLKKLSCQDEKITLCGYEARCFEEELKRTTMPILPFNDDGMVLFSDKFKELEAVEERAKNVEEQLKKHFFEIEEVKKIDSKELDWRNWDLYKTWCENLCSLCKPENEIPCQLLKNAEFMQQMCRRISEPLVERLFVLERKVSDFGEELSKFMDRTKEHYEKIALLEKCIEKIEVIFSKLNDNDSNFLATMEEIQDMLDCKLDKIHMPALKQYLLTRINDLESTLIELQQKKSCPQAAGIIMHGIQCASCKNSKVCARTMVPPTGMLPQLQRPQQKYKKKFCGCRLSKLESAQAHQSVPMRSMVQLQKQERPSKSCQKLFGETEYVTGKNGLLYRKG